MVLASSPKAPPPPTLGTEFTARCVWGWTLKGQSKSWLPAAWRCFQSPHKCVSCPVDVTQLLPHMVTSIVGHFLK